MDKLREILDIAQKHDKTSINITLKNGKEFYGEYYDFWGSPACIIVHLNHWRPEKGKWYDYFIVLEEIASIEVISPQCINYRSNRPA